MPIYEYACEACGHTFEEWQKMSDPPVKTCPKCKKKKVQKLISQTAFQLKVSGWYKDLYSSSKPGASARADSGGSSGKDGGGGGSDTGGKESGSTSSTDKKESKSDGPGAGQSANKDAKKKDSSKSSKPAAS